MSGMTKQKVSATVDRDALARAQRLLGTDTVSHVLDEALDALVERELERRWLAAHPVDGDRDDLPGSVEPDLSSVPWDD